MTASGKRGAINDLGIYGDGNDGAFTLDGSSTTGGGTWASNVYSLGRDAYYTALVIPSPYSLNINGFILRATQKIEIQSGGTLHANGGPGVSFNLGFGNLAGSLGGGTNGGIGASAAGAGAAGSAGTAVRGAAGGAGGAGGTGAAGAAGSRTVVTAAQGGWRQSTMPGFTSTAVKMVGGVGGGGGGGGSTGTGGGGGGGGGFLVALAPLIVIDGNIRSLGGDGGAGAAANGGGGGGGGGGVIWLAYQRKTGASATLTAATVCAGGAAGAKNGTGVVGSAGSTGVVYEIPMS